jgi:hypothetical protein
MGGTDMSNNTSKKKLVGPWRSLHAVIWLIGLYILFSRNQIFPGILVLMVISAIYEGLLEHFAPRAFEVQTPTEAPKPTEGPRLEPAPIVAPNPIQVHRLELLPQVCPSCNGPIRGHEVRWTGPQSANCPYCGTNLPMSKA